MTPPPSEHILIPLELHGQAIELAGMSPLGFVGGPHAFLEDNPTRTVANVNGLINANGPFMSPRIAITKS
jgi:hypothetical protein